MKKHITSCLSLLSISSLLFLQGCATGRTGEGGSAMTLISEGRERSLGEENYGPLIQNQGGYYRVDPAVQRYVERVGNSLVPYSKRSDLPYEFTVINSSVPNAWSLPGGKIGINRGLLAELESENELAAVLGHEMAHASERHVVERMEKQVLFGTILSVFSIVGAPGVAKSTANLGVNLVSAKFSRNDESEADRVGMETMARAGYDAEGAVALQETFVQLQKERQPNWSGGLFASHPPSKKRVEANRKTLATLQNGSKVGARDYQQAMRSLLATKEAYAALDKGEKALDSRKPEEALRYADEARQVIPDEAKVYSLIGRVRYGLGENREAVRYLSEAISRDPNYFFDYYARAVARYELKEYQGARSDLQRSLSLLETKEGKSLLAKVNKLLAGGSVEKRSGRTISRILSRVIIPLGEQSPAPSSG